MRRVGVWIGLVVVTLGFADKLTLRNGKVVEGTYLGGDARTIRMAVGDKIETFAVSEVRSLQFGPGEAAPAAPATATGAAGGTASRTPEPARATAAAASANEIPAGTELVVRMIDDVDSEVHRVGQTFRASVDEPVVVGGKTVIPRGADVVAKLVESKESGKLTGRAELTMDLVSITLNGKTYDIVTSEATTASEARGRQTAKVAGGAAALGAIIGGIAGGGRGAAIGAATGAGAGTAVQVFTKGQRVRIPSETRLSFTLQQPLRL
ncbi:MAG: hypothetical protein RMK57_08190 [Bryobacterales bacterium]|nr:hypothetical protein [Bryobacterales bacterium]